MTFSEAKNNLIIGNCFCIGSILKPHANKGQFSAKLFFDLEKLNLESILVEINKFLVPFFIDYKKSNFDSITQILKFDEINSINEAKVFSGKNLLLPYNSISNIEDFLVDWENFVVGFTVNDSKLGNIGTIDNFIEDNKNPLFYLDFNDKNHLIPLNSLDIIKSDYKNKIIYCDIPENILDL